MKAKEEMLYWLEHEHKGLYVRLKKEEYEAEHGEHFNECYAKKAVSHLCHTENGKEVCGEHWTIEQVKSVILPYKNLMNDDDTCWDAYVALHIFCHDLGANYKKRNVSLADNLLIEDAMTFFFDDEDAPCCKVWRYTWAMMDEDNLK